jgi:hypothetical protein
MAGSGEVGDTVLWTSDGTVNSSPQNDVGDAFVAVVHEVTARYEDGSPAQLTLALLVPGISSVLWKRGVHHGARAVIGGAEEGASVPIAGLRTVSPALIASRGGSSPLSPRRPGHGAAQTSSRQQKKAGT